MEGKEAMKCGNEEVYHNVEERGEAIHEVNPIASGGNSIGGSPISPSSSLVLHMPI